MIYLRTGLPGSGKTLRSVWEGMQAIAAGRDVYALNVTGLDFEGTGIKQAPIAHLSDWQDMPSGCVLIVDECQSYLPPRGATSKVPHWVEALTRNRHHGIDLHLITQHPRLIDFYVRELVNYHEHLVRVEGNIGAARVFYSEGLISFRGNAPSKEAAFKLWRYPHEVFSMYKSAQVHTIKRYIPQRLKLAGLALVVLVASVAGAYYAMSGIGKGSKHVQPAAAQVTTAQLDLPPSKLIDRVGYSGSTEAVGGWSSASEYADLHRPLIDGMPWSSRAYAARPVTANPEIHCISSENSCHCLSEQGTRIITADAVCRSIARYGVYNPYRQASSIAGVDAGRQSGALAAYRD